jgi:hypothetical protein
MIISSRPLNDLNKVLSRFFIANSLAILGILGGVIPEVSWRPAPIVFSQRAYTQDFNQNQINQYAKAVLDIEVKRKIAYSKIQGIIGRVPSQVSCNQKDSIKQLPRDAQVVAVNFCNESKKIVLANGLTAAQFNAITEAAQKDAPLKKRIQKSIVQIRKP